MKEAIKYTQAAIAVMVLTACGGGSDIPFFLSSNYGTWSGTTQQDRSINLTTTITLGQGGYYIDYRPRSNCYGQLMLVSESSVEAVFTERITFGFQSCINGGKVLVSKAASNELDFKWYDPLTNSLRVVGYLVKE